MIITYQRPDTIGHNLDPEAPDAAQSINGSECGAETIDTDGTEWRCTRAPHPGEDEHRAAYDRDGDGPDGAVAIAWTYQYADEDQTAEVTDNAALVHTVTVSFPDRAGGVDAEKIRTAILDLFWEGDADDIQITVSTT
ncbi:hypothetical protein B7R54_18705 [Subtercola boreus]|uniref:Uncharacterized protein n=1 Tax=Subtercola boreus TaxID=120213 RepID=A0A3E0V9Q2_9MICO|nr:hypothetical protein [Subtercola boreus]RFA06414.1 hypothetical protein B7R54_18705 [Subtercola boreus]TQL46855.1 hypothetical protein FB464_3849 [Subtercola boreus]